MLLLTAGALVASAAGCGDDPAAPLDASPDAGPPCEQGTEGCACFFGSGCKDGLLCITGRCLMTQGADEPEPTPRPRPIVQNPPGGDPPIGGTPDASVDDAGVGPIDAGSGLDAAADGG